MDIALAGASRSATQRMTRSAGGALARIHRVTFRTAGFLDEHLQVREAFGAEYRWHALLQTMLAQDALRTNLGSDLSEQLRDLVDANACFEDAMASGGPCLSHSDYKPWNLLVTQARLAAVLDWEFAFAAAPLNDIGNFLRYSARHVPEYESGFIEGYVEAGGKLPNDWRRLMRLVDLINLFDFVSRPDPSGTIVRDVKPLLEATLREYA
jgi:aminoglycoside phosphotransferase (APT) family kinase protein